MSRTRYTLDILVDGFSHRFGGGVSYLTGLLPPLAQQQGINRVRLLVEPGSALRETLRDSGVEIEQVRLRPRENLVARAAWEALALPRRTAGWVVIAPAAMLPRKLPSPVVAIPHNALPFESAGLRNRIQRRSIMQTLRWASGCIFVTEHMRQLVSRQGWLPRVKGVVHHGIAESFLRDLPEGRREGIVCVADAYPHKRLHLLVEAWRALGPARPSLRLVGRTMVGAPCAEPGLQIDSGLSADRVADLLRSARLAVLPSANESFGLPVLEALSCGTQLVASDIPAYREIAGGFATLVGENEPMAWSDALCHALESTPPMQRARAWARQFTWERSAAATAEILERAAATPPSSGYR